MATHTQAPHETLRAWQASYRLAIEVYKVSRMWPREERYGLTAQVRSAAYSVGANIAEGLARAGPRELHRFLSMALGSLAELQFALRIARDIDILTPVEWESLESARAETGKLTGSLAKSLRRRRSHPG
jgi:four helix bundle protein